MSVSSLVDQQVVEWDLTVWDWGELLQYLRKRSPSDVIEVFWKLQSANINVNRQDVEEAINTVLRLPRLSQRMRQRLESMAASIACQARREPGDLMLLAGNDIEFGLDGQSFSVSGSDTENDLSVDLFAVGSESGAIVLRASGQVEIHDPKAVDELVQWLLKRQKALWSGD